MSKHLLPLYATENEKKCVYLKSLLADNLQADLSVPPWLSTNTSEDSFWRKKNQLKLTRYTHVISWLNSNLYI